MNPKDDGQCIYLFNSAPVDRPAYRRGVLDALGYPEGHRIVMSYQRKYIDPNLLQPGCLEGRTAALVFLDRNPGNQDHTFIPIRFAQIVHCSSPQTRNRVEIRVELQQLIRPDGLSDASIKALKKRPVPFRPGTTAPGSQYYFVLEDTPVLRVPDDDQSEQDIWEELADQVKKSQTLSDATIISLSHLRNHGKSQSCRLNDWRNRDKVYELRPNTIYELDLRVFDTAAQTNLVVRSSSDLVAVTQAFPTTIGGLGTYRVVIACKRTLESSLAAIFVDIDDSDDQQTSTSIKHHKKLRNAQPVYLAHISPSLPLLVIFVALVFLGILSSSLSKDFFEQNPVFALGFPVGNVALMSKIVGAALLAAAAWLGLRKLPSGTSAG